jgi:hypothetical protein
MWDRAFNKAKREAETDLSQLARDGGLVGEPHCHRKCLAEYHDTNVQTKSLKKAT